MNYHLTTVEGFEHPKDPRSYVVEIFNTPDTVSLDNQVSQFMLSELGPHPGVGPLVGTLQRSIRRHPHLLVVKQYLGSGTQIL